jgi:hypothetical protein
VEGDELRDAVRSLSALTQRSHAQRVADQLPEDVRVADLLRAADGMQQVARALAAKRRGGATNGRERHDPHDVRSLYS